MISINSRGSFDNLESFMRSMQKRELFTQLDALAQEGVNALAAATPSTTGLAAASWKYEIVINRSTCVISFLNTDIENGFPVVIGLQYGHGTGTGGYVQGVDFINPALAPIFDKITNKVWKAVTSA